MVGGDKKRDLHTPRPRNTILKHQIIIFNTDNFKPAMQSSLFIYFGWARFYSTKTTLQTSCKLYCHQN